MISISNLYFIYLNILNLIFEIKLINEKINFIYIRNFNYIF